MVSCKRRHDNRMVHHKCWIDTFWFHESSNCAVTWARLKHKHICTKLIQQSCVCHWRWANNIMLFAKFLGSLTAMRAYKFCIVASPWVLYSCCLIPSPRGKDEQNCKTSGWTTYLTELHSKSLFQCWNHLHAPERWREIDCLHKWLNLSSHHALLEICSPGCCIQRCKIQLVSSPCY